MSLQINDDVKTDAGNYVGASNDASDKWWWCPWQVNIMPKSGLAPKKLDKCITFTHTHWKMYDEQYFQKGVKAKKKGNLLK